MCERCGEAIQPFADAITDDGGFRFHDYCYAEELRDLKWEYNALEEARLADEEYAETA